jgi:hypothetical protein
MGKYYGLNLLSIEEQTLPGNLAGHYYTLKMKERFGIFASVIVPATRWFVKIFLKKKVHTISGPYIFVAFEK